MLAGSGVVLALGGSPVMSRANASEVKQANAVAPGRLSGSLLLIRNQVALEEEEAIISDDSKS